MRCACEYSLGLEAFPCPQNTIEGEKGKSNCPIHRLAATQRGAWANALTAVSRLNKASLRPRSGRLLICLEILAQDCGGDFQFQDFVGAFVDAADADVLQVSAGAIEGRPAAAAVDLHGPVGGVPGGIRSK